MLLTVAITLYLETFKKNIYLSKKLQHAADFWFQLILGKENQ